MTTTTTPMAATSGAIQAGTSGAASVAAPGAVVAAVLGAGAWAAPPGATDGLTPPTDPAHAGGDRTGRRRLRTISSRLLGLDVGQPGISEGGHVHAERRLERLVVGAPVGI